MKIPMSIQIKQGESLIQIETEAFPFPADLQDLLPVFRSITDDLVNIAIHEAATENKAISCKPGCTACCYMAVPVSEPEAYRLRALVDGMPEEQRSAVQARFSAAMDLFRNTGLLEELFQSPLTEDDIPKKMANLNAYYAKWQPCPFLENDKCSIYAERPLICREFMVSSPPENCSNIEGEGVERLLVPSRPARALIAITSHRKESGEAVLPLIQILEWTSETQDPLEVSFGPEWVALFGSALQAKTDESMKHLA
jgi:Fe-S-cluster containining protein